MTTTSCIFCSWLTFFYMQSPITPPGIESPSLPHCWTWTLCPHSHGKAWPCLLLPRLKAKHHCFHRKYIADHQVFKVATHDTHYFEIMLIFSHQIHASYAFANNYHLMDILARINGCMTTLPLQGLQLSADHWQSLIYAEYPQFTCVVPLGGELCHDASSSWQNFTEDKT